MFPVASVFFGCCFLSFFGKLLLFLLLLSPPPWPLVPSSFASLGLASPCLLRPQQVPGPPMCSHHPLLLSVSALITQCWNKLVFFHHGSFLRVRTAFFFLLCPMHLVDVLPLCKCLIIVERKTEWAWMHKGHRALGRDNNLVTLSRVS